MIFQCGDLERALCSPELMPDARAHAETCERCRRELALWEEISRLAPQLHQEWESAALWPRIRANLGLEPARLRRRAWRWALAVAASVALAVLLFGPRRGAPASSPELLTDAALQEVDRAETAYVQSIGRLAAVAGPGLEQSASPVAAAYREKLTLLDAAIAEARSAAGEDRYNAYLRGELAALYSEKRKTLQEWMEYAKRK